MEPEIPTPSGAEINKPVIDMEPFLERVAPIGGVFSSRRGGEKINVSSP